MRFRCTLCVCVDTVYLDGDGDGGGGCFKHVSVHAQ